MTQVVFELLNDESKFNHAQWARWKLDLVCHS